MFEKKKWTANARIHQLFKSSFSGIMIVTTSLYKDQHVGAQLVSRSDVRSWSLTWRTWHINAPRPVNTISFRSTCGLNLNARDGFVYANNSLHVWCWVMNRLSILYTCWCCWPLLAKQLTRSRKLNTCAAVVDLAALMHWGDGDWNLRSRRKRGRVANHRKACCSQDLTPWPSCCEAIVLL